MMTTAIRLALASLLITTVAAQYSVYAPSAPILQRGVASADGTVWRLTNTSIADVKGVWLNTGRVNSRAQLAAVAEGSMPNCALDNSTTIANYTGLDSAPQYYALNGLSEITAMTFALQRSTFAANVTYRNNFVVRVANGATTCTHFAPYINLATGELLADSIAITQFSMNASNPNAAPIRTNLNCEVVGNEMPGCYTGTISTSGMTPTAPSMSVMAASIGAPAPRPSGSIRTVVRNTYTCQNGECLKLSPKYSTTSPAYVHSG